MWATRKVCLKVALLLLLAVYYAFSLLIDLIWKWIEKAFHPR